ncbi:MAG: class I SAM-dependent methyltransferase [Betaproteobacteria bacterium]|nr:class I SAM-dependent methyltransferase [Betaproteobacteria bacterium]
MLSNRSRWAATRNSKRTQFNQEQLNEMSGAIYAVLVLSASTLVVVALMLRKVTRTGREVWALKQWTDECLNRHFHHAYRQVEGLHALYATLSPQVGLPALRGWAGSPDFLAELARQVLERKPDNVVECSSGTSTLVIAKCLRRIGRGHVYSLEHEAHYAEQTRRLLKEHGVEAFATVITAPLHETRAGSRAGFWYSGLDALPETLQMVVVDGPPGTTSKLARYPAGPLLIPRLDPGGLMLLDDADRNDEKEMVKLWQMEIPGLSVTRLDAEKGLVAIERRRE